jgi:hypothetical protein
MVSGSWFVVLLTSALLWPAADGRTSHFRSSGHDLGCPIGDGSPIPVAGGYGHRVFETHMLPYFAQFPVVELDRASARVWSRVLYRSNLARYGDQWDWQARRSYAALVVGLQKGWIVPRSRLAAMGSRGRSVGAETGQRRPSPVKVTNPFCDETWPASIDRQEGGLTQGTSDVTLRAMSSASVMPLRIANPFVP